MQKTQLEKISNQKAAIIESYLKEFGQDKDKGTGFYSDITVLRGPSTSEYKYFENKRPDLIERSKSNEVEIYNIKFAGISFVLEYKTTHFVNGQLYRKPARIPSNAFCVLDGRESQMPLYVATAARDWFLIRNYGYVQH